jgi:SAM-dependent MidA family methyltransferase
MTLRQKIEQEIRERGPIPFSRYMELCLYDPELGYYSRNAEKFGKAGDFYTSSDVHAVFGRVLARQFEEIWGALGKPDHIELLELGPGRGLFAQDVLDWSEKKFSDFYRSLHYTLAESSPSLRKRLQASFGARIKAGKVTLLPQADNSMQLQTNIPARRSAGEGARRSTDSLSSRMGEGCGHAPDDRAFNTKVQHEREGHGFSRAEMSPILARALAPEVPILVFANEFFDALPVDVLSEKGSLRIATRDGRFVEEWVEPSPEELEFLNRYGVHPENGTRTEIALLAQRTMTQITASIECGFLIAIDYGYTREQQLGGRHFDTLMTYRQHSATPDPYQAPGEQDITAHVNFTALAAAAEQNVMQVHKLLTQSQFLMGIGEATQFADAFEDCRLPQERAKVALQLKHLVTPEGMGETFQVMLASKGMDTKLVEKLAGLTFGV